MARKFFSAMVLACLLVFSANICAAGTFQTIYNSEKFTDDLRNDQAVDETFNTNDGKLRLQIRRLANSSAEKQMHGIIWLNNERIYDEYFPEVAGGYTFRAIKNTADSRQFYVIQSRDRAFLLGYSPAGKKIETYIDSQSYYCDFQAAPTIVTTKNGNLILAFENYAGTLSARYHFTWDNNKQWFGYSNLGTYRYSVNRDRP